MSHPLEMRPEMQQWLDQHELTADPCSQLGSYWVMRDMDGKHIASVSSDISTLDLSSILSVRFIAHNEGYQAGRAAALEQLRSLLGIDAAIAKALESRP